jgi:integrase
MILFQSVFAEHLSGYMKLRRGLGFRFQTEADLLRLFDRYVHERGHTELTQELALNFASDNPDTSTNYRAQRYQVARQFSEYLATFHPRTPLLDPKAMVRSRSRTPPYIYTDEELACLLGEARHLSAKHPVRGITVHTMIGLTASIGLRISEVVGLDRPDVDLATGSLLVRQSKFGKDRYVPVHITTLEVLRYYATVRDAAFPNCHHPAFFLNLSQRRYSPNTLQQVFCRLARRAGLRGPKGRGASFHDLRHRFAVKRLVAWYKAGIDVQAMLPALATYMGHVHYSDTAYYLTATAELLGLAAGLHERSLQQEEAHL